MNIQEIAHLAHVSPATVSRVFSHHPVKEEIRRRVLEIARENHYHPRFSTRQRNVVIITPYDAVFPVQSCIDMLMMALAQVLPKREFRLEILPINNLSRLESIQFCGAVTLGVEPSEIADWSRRFSVPLIVVDRHPIQQKRGDNVFFVFSDEEQAMELAVDQLYRGNCRKIGCIVHGTPERGNAAIRYAAIEKALKRRALPVDRMIYYAGDSSDKYVELTGKLLQAGADALFCPGGNAGLMALYSFALFNKKTPDDIALIASEQTAFSSFTVPPLTTISPDYRQIAESVADLLDAWLDRRDVPRTTKLPYHLIVRESTPVAR